MYLLKVFIKCMFCKCPPSKGLIIAGFRFRWQSYNEKRATSMGKCCTSHEKYIIVAVGNNRATLCNIGIYSFLLSL